MQLADLADALVHVVDAWTSKAASVPRIEPASGRVARRDPLRGERDRTRGVPRCVARHRPRRAEASAVGEPLRNERIGLVRILRSGIVACPWQDLGAPCGCPPVETRTRSRRMAAVLDQRQLRPAGKGSREGRYDVAVRREGAVVVARGGDGDPDAVPRRRHRRNEPGFAGVVWWSLSHEEAVRTVGRVEELIGSGGSGGGSVIADLAGDVIGELRDVCVRRLDGREREAWIIRRSYECGGAGRRGMDDEDPEVERPPRRGITVRVRSRREPTQCSRQSLDPAPPKLDRVRARAVVDRDEEQERATALELDLLDELVDGRPVAHGVGGRCRSAANERHRGEEGSANGRLHAPHRARTAPELASSFHAGTARTDTTRLAMTHQRWQAAGDGGRPR